MTFEQTSRNFSIIVTEVGGVVVIEDDYDSVLTDLWVSVTLSLMVISCIGILCSCFLYHKFQQWKFQVLESQVHERQHRETGINDTESLPSYTLVTGLPSYAEAMEQLREVQCTTGKVAEPALVEIQPPPPSTLTPSNLSVSELLQFYRPPNFK